MVPAQLLQSTGFAFVLNVACAVLLFASGSAQAASLPAASTSARCFADGNNAFHPTECQQGGFVGVPPSAFASATLSPFPAVSVEVSAPPATVLGAGADATALYYFQVTGGNAGDVVPILIDFRLEVSVTPDSTALARIKQLFFCNSERPFFSLSCS